jgi:aspergillopepsin I
MKSPPSDYFFTQIIHKMQLLPKTLVFLLQVVSINGLNGPYFHKNSARQAPGTPVCPDRPLYDFSSFQQPGGGFIRTTVAVTDDKGYAAGRITFGDQTLPVCFDTGSATDWVLGPGVTGPGGLPLQKPATDTYIPLLSVTKTPLPGSFCQPYADGDRASGPIYSEIFTVGGIPFPPSTLGVANFSTPNFLVPSRFPFDGVLGLAPPGGNKYYPTQQPAWVFRNLELFETKVFASALKKDAAGTFDFGFINAKKYTGSLVYTLPINPYSPQVWAFVSSGLRLASGFPFISPAVTIVDSGNPNIRLVPTLATAYYAQVENKTLVTEGGISGYTVPCNATLPDLSFYIRDSNYVTIPGSLLVEPPSVLNNRTVCFGSVQAGTPEYNLMGAPLYRSYYIVHNMLNLSIGFAPQAATSPGLNLFG